MYADGESMQRMLFHEDHKLADFEQKSLDGFRQYIRDNRLALPAG